jgi:hypothetical protein
VKSGAGAPWTRRRVRQKNVAVFGERYAWRGHVEEEKAAEKNNESTKKMRLDM